MLPVGADVSGPGCLAAALAQGDWFSTIAYLVTSVAIDAPTDGIAVEGWKQLLQRLRMDIGRDLFLPLETTRLRLRFVEPGDAGSVSRLMTPSVSRWVISWPVPFTGEMAAERIDRARDGAAGGTMLPFAIERRSDGAFLGWLSATRIAERRALLSYWLGEEHHGHGYMREAVAVALAAAFRLLDVDVVEAAAQPGNEPSLAVLRGCGMVLVGERMIFAPSRGRDELCVVLELRRPGS